MVNDMNKENRYQAKDGFVAREIAGEMLLIPTGTRTQEFNGMIRLNETGIFIWSQVERPKSINELIKSVTEEFEVSDDLAEQHIRAFIEKGLQNGLITKL